MTSLASVPKSTQDKMTTSDDATKKFWAYLDAFYYQQGSLVELEAALAPGSVLHESTFPRFFGHFSPILSPTTPSPPFPGRTILDQARKTVHFSSLGSSDASLCINHTFRLYDQFLQMCKAPEYSNAERKRWKGNPIEVCEHLLLWSDQQLAKIVGGTTASAPWIFNFLLRLEQLIQLTLLISPTTEANNRGDDENKSDIFQELMVKHRLLADRLAKCLPRTSYHACFDEEEKDVDSARFVKLDKIKWTTGLPKAINQLTNDYCRFDILSDHEVNIVLERVRRIANESIKADIETN